MWFVLIFISACFSALTMVATKLGVKTSDPILASTINTFVVFAISWAVVFATGAQEGLARIDSTTMVFLLLSGAATGGVWIANFAVLKIGDCDTYMAVVRCSMALIVVLSFVLLGDPFTLESGLGAAFIVAGSVLMADRRSRSSGKPVSRTWVALTLVAIVLSSASTLFGKVGINGVDSNLGTAIFTLVIIVMTNAMAIPMGKWKLVAHMSRKELGFTVLAGAASAVTTLTFYAGLKLQYTSIVMPVDKLLSAIITLVMAYFVFGETVNRRAAFALCLIGVGTALLAF